MAKPLIVIDPDPPKKVLDFWDFTFSNGLFYPIVLDLEAGDKIKFSSAEIRISISARPSATNPDTMEVPEEITIFTSNLNSISHRQHEVQVASTEQKAELHKTIQELLSSDSPTKLIH